MIPNFQFCKDSGCEYWKPELLDCDRLPENCPYSVYHLVLDRKNQSLDGVKHGIWKLIDKSEMIYICGRLIEWRQYYKNGQLAQIIPFNKGKQEGLFRSFYDTGQKKVECSYKGGERNGKFTEWDKDGIVKTQGEFDKGKKVGKWI